MSECRALTNFTGNAVATLLIGKWTHELDIVKAREVLSGRDPFDEINMEDDGHGGMPAAEEAVDLPVPAAQRSEERVPVGV